MRFLTIPGQMELKHLCRRKDENQNKFIRIKIQSDNVIASLKSSSA